MTKPLSKRTRTNLLTLAAWLERRAARIRAYVNARTPRRGPRKAKGVA